MLFITFVLVVVDKACDELSVAPCDGIFSLFSSSITLFMMSSRLKFPVFCSCSSAKFGSKGTMASSALGFSGTTCFWTGWGGGRSVGSG